MAAAEAAAADGLQALKEEVDALDSLITEIDRGAPERVLERRGKTRGAVNPEAAAAEASAAAEEKVPHANVRAGRRIAAAAQGAVSAVNFSTYGGSEEDAAPSPEEHASPQRAAALPKSLAPIAAAGGASAGRAGLRAAVRHADPLSGGNPFGKSRLPGLRHDDETSPPPPQHQQQQQQQRQGSPSARPQPAQGRPEGPAACGVRSASALRVMFPSGGIVPAKRWGLCMAAHKHSVYVYGGMRGDTGAPAGDLHEFQLDRREWSACFVEHGQPPQPRYDAAMAVCGDSLFVFGGAGEGAALLGDCHEYRIEPQEWVALKAEGEIDRHPPARADHSLCSQGRRLYLFGGRCAKPIKGAAGSPRGEGGARRTKVAFAHDLWCCDTRSGRWRQYGRGSVHQPPRRSGHAAAIVAKRLYIHGGGDAEQTFNDLWEFDLPEGRAGLWRLVATSGPPRRGHAMLAAGSAALCYGGLGPAAAGAADGDLELLQWYDTNLIERGPETAAAKGADSPPQSPGAGEAEGAERPEGSTADPVAAGTGRWVPLALFGALQGARLQSCAAAAAGGFLYTFGGAVHGEAHNLLRRVLLRNDIDIDTRGLSDTLARLLRRAQVRPEDALADLHMTINGRSVWAHRCIVSARCPRFYEAVLKCGAPGETAYVLDGNRRRQGLPAVSDSEALLSFLHFLYTGRLREEADAGVMQDLGVAFSSTAMVELLTSLHPPELTGAGGLRHGRVRDDDASPARHRPYDGEQLLAQDLKALLASGEHADLTLTPRPAGEGRPADPVRAHRCLLCASSHLARQAIGAAAAKRGGTVGSMALPEVSRRGLELALEWVYSGHCSGGVDDAVSVLGAAKALGLPGLRSLCEGLLWHELGDRPASLPDLLTIAARFEAPQLREQCLARIAAYDDVSALPGGDSLGAELQREIGEMRQEMGLRAAPAAALGTQQQPTAVYQQRSAGSFAPQ